MTFELEVTDRDTHASTGGVAVAAGDAGLGKLRLIAHRLLGKLAQLENQQSLHWHRERLHRDTAEAINARVAWWKVAEVVVVLAVTVSQTVLTMSWFTRRPGGGAKAGDAAGVRGQGGSRTPLHGV